MPLTLAEPVAAVRRKLLPGGELDDNASPELARLRREMNAQRTRLTKSLEALMRDTGDAIQDQIVTVRNDRFVIPCKGRSPRPRSRSCARIFVFRCDRLH